MLSSSYTLLIVSVGVSVNKLIRSRIFTVVGTTYLPLCGCEFLLGRIVCVFSFVIAHLTTGMRYRFALGHLHPLITASSETFIFTVLASYRFTFLSLHTDTYPACENFPLLRRELLVRDRTMSTVRVGSRTLWCSLARLNPGIG